MSNPIVQIKRASFSASPGGAGYFHLGTLSYGELGYWHQYSGNRHYLFIGDSGSSTILLNPQYNFSLSGTNETSGYRLTYQLTKDNITSGSPGDPISQVAVSVGNFVIPIANEENAVGLITNGNQTIAGNKTFMDSILPENEGATIGASNQKWSNIFADNFIGNASTASKFESKVKINNTDFDGSSAITTDLWGAERNISISGTASATAANGTNINGSNANGYVLRIPNTMTGFASITANTLLPDASTGSSLGSATQIWSSFYTKNSYIYNSDGSHYVRLWVDTPSDGYNYSLALPSAPGELLYHAIDTQVGSATAPIYIASSGAATACSTIDVAHGGTGVATITSNGIVIGKGANAIATIAPVAKGSILVSNGTSAAPIYAAPSLSWSAGNTTTAPTVSFNLNSQSTSVTIPFASSSATGLVNTTTQTFAGAKTFSGAITASSTLTATGKITANGGAEIKDNLIATSIISSTNTTKSSITLSNSLISMLSTKISLDGKIVLTNDSYGTALPTSGMEEGQIFFLIS